MHYARLNGTRVEARDISLEDARGQRFICHECEVPVDVVAMPGLDKTPGWKRGRPGFSELYFRVTKPIRHGACPFAPRYVAAVIEEVVIASRMGGSGAPPSSIRLSPAEAVAVLVGTTTGEGEDARRVRHVDGWGSLRKRGDRATVVPGIESACRAYLEISGIREQPLRIDVLRERRTYGEVFTWMEDWETPAQRIWVGTPLFQQMPAYGEALLTLRMFKGQIVIDRRTWNPRRVARFDVDLEISLTWMREHWLPGAQTWQPRCFAFGECPSTGTIVVSDPRAFSLLIDATKTKARAPSLG